MSVISFVPRILTVGPSVSIDGQAVATVDLGMDLAVNLTYKVNNLTLFFPPSDDHKSVADVSPNNTREYPYLIVKLVC